LLVGYRWFDTRKIPVMFPFGYGLTYTIINYTGLKTDKTKYGRNDVIEVTVDLENTGKMAADEVVQIYIHRINPSVEWPEKELKAFSRVTLRPGEKKDVTLMIPVKKLMYWNKAKQNWDNDLCNIEVLACSSAADIKLKKQVALR
jgi:beta-glucosidase